MSGPLWLMKLVPALTTEVVAPMVTEGAAVAAVATVEEDKEGTRITINLSLLKKHKTYL